MRLIQVDQASATKRRVFFFCVDATDGITPETGEAGGQPEISIDGAGWPAVGIGVLVDTGSGYYYAELDQATVGTVGQIIETRYKSAATAETPGTVVQVVTFDPDDVATATDVANAVTTIEGQKLILFSLVT